LSSNRLVGVKVDAAIVEVMINSIIRGDRKREVAQIRKDELIRRGGEAHQDKRKRVAREVVASRRAAEAQSSTVQMISTRIQSQTQIKLRQGACPPITLRYPYPQYKSLLCSQKPCLSRVRCPSSLAKPKRPSLPSVRSLESAVVATRHQQTRSPSPSQNPTANQTCPTCQKKNQRPSFHSAKMKAQQV
jgi:hypothetical protein